MAGLSQGEMQKRTGILRSYLSRVENGHTTPSLATLQRLTSGPWQTFSRPKARRPRRLRPMARAILEELKSYLPQLSPEQRRELLVKKMARSGIELRGLYIKVTCPAENPL